MSKITVTLSTSAISEAAKCPHAWALGYRENLLKSDAKMIHLDEGALFHAMLEIYYHFRTIHPQTMNFVHNKLVVDVFETHEVYAKFNVGRDRWNFLKARFFEYCAYYSQNDFKVIKNGLSPAIEMGFSKVLFENDDFLFVVESRLDMVVIVDNKTGALGWVDHKTQVTEGNLYEYSPQFLTYAWATGFQYGYINYIRFQKEFNKNSTLVRRPINFPEWRVKEWELELINLFMTIGIVLQNTNGTSEDFPRVRSSCGGAFNKTPCQYVNICDTQSLEMRETIKQFQYIKQAPRRSWK